MDKQKFAEELRNLLIDIKEQIIDFFPCKSEEAINLLKWVREKIIKK